MASKAHPIEPLILTVASRAGLLNLILGVVGVVACTMISHGAAAGFALGLVAGLFNQYLCLKIVRRGLLMEPERAKTFVTTRLSMRFALTATVMVVLVSKAMVNPWTMLLGFALTLLNAILTIVFIPRRWNV
jgi:hypothetical protein